MIFEIAREWALCRAALLPAIEMTGGTHTEDDVLAALIAGRMRLWRKDTSGLVTEFCQFPRMKVINVFLAGGRLEDILPLQAEIENYGRKQGCQRATMLAARDGWLRTIGGGQKAGIYMTKDL
ncbi:MAG: hypothetical protein K2P94_18060 [Rhodospirillaceae bacterium]|nr:hypothetical protein [Rhodospirillaceae bacterium]